jgi:hypothetical protein
VITIQTVAGWLVFVVGALVILAWTFAYVRQKVCPAPTIPAPTPPTPAAPDPAAAPQIFCPCPKRAVLSTPIRTEIHGSISHLCYLCTVCKSEVKLPVK